MLAIAAAAWGQASPESPVLTAERTAGPFAFGERSFQAVLRLARLPGGVEETVASVEVRDADGALHFQRTLPYRADGKRFEETSGADAALLQGKKGSGLLLAYTVLPAAQLSGRSWQVLGVVEGKFQPFSKPVALEGGLVENTPGWDSALETDVLNFRVWTGRFFVIVPLAVNWEWGYFRPAYHLTQCRWSVEAERRAGTGQATVRLLPQPGGAAGGPEAVSVTPGSKVEFLGAEGGVVWDESDEQIWLGVSEIVWLRVRVDGKEGWLRDPEDLDAIGLPETR
ncbi:MAG TPA: hypothetical protein VLH09_11070 [Bryobacteraceae bacterium]|nr:hypothetical protein [Bryobacteraceae bacterium]